MLHSSFMTSSGSLNEANAEGGVGSEELSFRIPHAPFVMCLGNKLSGILNRLFPKPITIAARVRVFHGAPRPVGMLIMRYEALRMRHKSNHVPHLVADASDRLLGAVRISRRV